MRKTECSKCQHGDVNLWGYTECWKFDRELDLDKTIHTAHREKEALALNATNNCVYYVNRMKWFSRFLCRHPQVRFIRNLYGKEIEESNGCRSFWECDSCGLPIYKDNFVPEKTSHKGT